MLVSLPRPLLVSALILLPGAPPDEVAFRPEADRVIVRTFALAGEGQGSAEHESDRGSGSSTSSSTIERALVVTDRILAADGERVLEFERTYDEVGSESINAWENDDGGHEGSSSGESEVEGATVTFAWDEDEEDWIATSDELDDDVLLDLRVDLDFTFLLPDGDVAEGDEWEIDVDAWVELRDPWEGLPWSWTRTFDGEVQESEEGEDDTDEQDGDEHSGEVVVRYAGQRDEDGATVAVLEIEGRIETESSSESSREFDQGSMTSYNESLEERSIQGEVLWLVDEGRLLSAHIEVEVEISGSTEMEATFGDQEFSNSTEFEQTQTIVLTGAFELEGE